MLKKRRKRFNQNLLDFFIGRPRYRKKQILIEMIKIKTEKRDNQLNIF